MLEERVRQNGRETLKLKKMKDTTSTLKVTEISFDIIHLLDVLKWPLLILIIILIFRKEIINLINRLTKLKYGGTSVEAQQQLVNENQENKKKSTVDKVLGLYKEETTNFFQDFVKQDTDIEKLGTEKEKVQRLINYSITLYIEKEFEKLYNLIFGSQIMILQQLNTGSKEDLTSLISYYNLAVEQNPKFFGTYSYENYMGFLISYQLISKEGEQIKITFLGIDFLKYMTETGKNFNKYN